MRIFGETATFDGVVSWVKLYVIFDWCMLLVKLHVISDGGVLVVILHVISDGRCPSLADIARSFPMGVARR